MTPSSSITPSAILGSPNSTNRNATRVDDTSAAWQTLMSLLAASKQRSVPGMPYEGSNVDLPDVGDDFEELSDELGDSNSSRRYEAKSEDFSEFDLGSDYENIEAEDDRMDEGDIYETESESSDTYETEDEEDELEEGELEEDELEEDELEEDELEEDELEEGELDEDEDDMDFVPSSSDSSMRSTDATWSPSAGENSPMDTDDDHLSQCSSLDDPPSPFNPFIEVPVELDPLVLRPRNQRQSHQERLLRIRSLEEALNSCDNDASGETFVTAEKFADIALNDDTQLTLAALAYMRTFKGHGYFSQADVDDF